MILLFFLIARETVAHFDFATCLATLCGEIHVQEHMGHIYAMYDVITFAYYNI